MRDYFKGWYLKHQKGGTTLALIPGRSADEAFIQVVTCERAYHIPYPADAYSEDRRNGIVKIADSLFSRRGACLHISSDELRLNGVLRYSGLTPVSGDIMGPFRFLPMECRHSIVSMNHTVSGTLSLNGRTLDLDGGKGYIEGDRGRSFPESYTWVQSNDFDRDCSIMATAAKIPLAGARFWGCVCVVWVRGREYRLATYKGAKLVRRTETTLELRQGSYRLIVGVDACRGHALAAPDRGVMRRTIHEAPACKARFRFLIGGRTIINARSEHTSYEYSK